jgi:hypothetical protein
METIRVICIYRVIKHLVPVIAIFEIVIWLPARKMVTNDLFTFRKFQEVRTWVCHGDRVGFAIN